jgi:kojibiose phosphorylase
MNLENFLSNKEWWIEENDFDPKKLNLFETLFTIGNGYLGTRGALEEGHRAGLPGTYLNGIFDNHQVWVTTLINAPDWLSLQIWANGQKISLEDLKVLKHRRVLDLKHGLLYRDSLIEDSLGQITRLETLRYASFANQHCVELNFSITPENYSGEILVQSAVEGNVSNLDRMPVYQDIPEFAPEMRWQKWSRSIHLKPRQNFQRDNYLYLEMETIGRPYQIGYANFLAANEKAELEFQSEKRRVANLVKIKVQKGKTVNFSKLTTIFTSRDQLDNSLEKSCLETLSQEASLSFAARLEKHQKVWEQKWKDSDCVIVGDEKAQLALRFNIYHLLICANENDPHVNIGARSLSGEGYKGHAFWDTEIFLLPFYIYTQPKTAKSLLKYRYYTLDGARKNALATNSLGARFPWESADTGLEETPKWTPDGKDRFWTGEEEIHITADVCYSLVNYFNATRDQELMLNFGGELIFETARFFASRLEYNSSFDRYELKCVIGPDEFHEHINNNIFTNRLAKFNLEEAVKTFSWLKSFHPEKSKELNEKISLSDEEISNFSKIAAKIYLPIDPKKHLIEQFEGYFKLKDVPITEYDQNGMPVYPEGRNQFSCNDCMLIKQADVVMLLYLLPDEFSEEMKKINFEYYEKRTLHKSSLSPSIYAIMALEVGDPKKVMQYFQNTAWVDLANNQNNSEWGIHIASSGGLWQLMVFGFGGMRVKKQKLTFKPWLPKEWKEIKFKIKWQEGDLSVVINHQKTKFLWQSETQKEMEIEVLGKNVVLTVNSEI